MTKNERYKGVIEWFSRHVPVAEMELHYADSFQLLIAVILSVQCTDKRVNMITPALYGAFPTVEILAAASPDAVYEYIKTVSRCPSFPNEGQRIYLTLTGFQTLLGLSANSAGRLLLTQYGERRYIEWEQNFMALENTPQSILYPLRCFGRKYLCRDCLVYL